MPDLKRFEWIDLPLLFRQASAMLREVDTVVDVGAGIRPQPIVRAKHHICIEPHHEYAQFLRSKGYEVLQDTALDALDGLRADTVVMLDVIEHMEKETGFDVIRLALEAAREQVVVFTPLGFMPQSGGDQVDPWGLHGQPWQKHRSGWSPDDFKGWTCLSEPSFHYRDGKNYGAFFAIHG